MDSWIKHILGFVITVNILIGLSSCDNHTYYFRVSAVIKNRNFTKNMVDLESTARKNMTTEILQGLKYIYELRVEKYISTYKAELKEVIMKDIYFGSPSFQESENTSLIEKKRHKFEDPEIGVYFLTIMRLEFDISKPEGSFNNINGMSSYLQKIVFEYVRFKNTDFLGNTLLRLNVTTLHSEEISLAVARRLADIVKFRNHFVPTFVHQNVVSDTDRDILSIISYVGCGFSLFGLFTTILTIIASRKLRRHRANQILLQMCMSLLGALLFYAFGIRQLKDESLIETCKAISALLHYFILASMIWASIEAYNLYQDLVKVFDTSTLSHNEFMFRASLAGWVPPGIIVGATVLVSSTSYGFHVPDKEHTLCWLKLEAFYGALLSPVLLLVIGNTVIFVIVMREIFKMPQAHEKHSKMAQFRATVSVFTLLGLNWIFAGLAAATPIHVFQYLFTVTCSFQGFFIFILHGLLKNDFRDAWGLLKTKNRVMQILRSSNSQSQKTNSSSLSNSQSGKTHSSSLSHNYMVPSHSQSFSNPCQVTFERMKETDSGTEVKN